MFAIKLAPNVPNNMLINLLYFPFNSFSIVLLTHFIDKPDSLRDLTVLMISFLSLFDILNVVVPSTKIVF